MGLYSEFIGLGHSTHTHTHTVSSHVLPALLVIPQTNYSVFSSSSFLLLHLAHSTISFQLQLDLDKDGFSFSSLFFPALAKEGFARGDYTQTQAYLRACSQTTAWRHCISGKTSLLTNSPHPPPLYLSHPPRLHYSDKLHSQRSTTSLAFSVFHCFSPSQLVFTTI